MQKVCDISDTGNHIKHHKTIKNRYIIRCHYPASAAFGGEHGPDLCGMFDA
jgi:hypothetical protein